MKNSKVFFIVLAVVALLPMAACGRTHVKSSDYFVTQPVKQKLGSFDKISVIGSVDVEFTVGNTRSMEIYGADNVIQYVELSVRNNTLYVNLSNDVNIYGKTRLTLLVTAPTLTEISVSGSGDVEVRNLNVASFKATVAGSGDVELNNLTAKKVDLSLTGSGDIEVRGTADKATYSVKGSGDIDAEHLVVRELTASVSGSGDIECYAEESLDATVSGSGEISYRGNPAKVNRSGRESSIHRDY